MRPLRVLHVIPSVSPTQGGPSAAIAALETALAEQGVDVTTLTTDDDGPGARRIPLAPSDALRIYVAKRTDFYKFAPGAVGWLWKHVANYDVVHIHALFSFVSTFAALICRARGVPYIVRPLGTLNTYGIARRRPWLKKLSIALVERPILSRAAFVHFTSPAELAQASELGIAFRGVVVPLGISKPVLPPSGCFRASQPSLGSRDYLLFLSRIDPKKNIETVLEAFATLRRSFPELALVIAGAGPADYVSTLQRKAEALGTNADVLWTGHLDGDLKWDALRGACAFVLPSFSENFGIAAAEALLAGTPCVLGEGVAISADVARAGAGIAVLPDASSLAAAVAKLVSEPLLRQRMSECARTLGHQQYSASTMAARLEQLYSEISTERGAPMTS